MEKNRYNEVLSMKYGKQTGILLLCILLLQGCGSGDTQPETETQSTVIDFNPQSPENDASEIPSAEGAYSSSIPLVEWKDKELYTEPVEGISIDLSAPAAGDGYTMKEGSLTITKGGTYLLSGTLEEGQVVVEAAKSDDVRLVLHNVSVHSTVASPIEIKSADSVVISLPEGTENHFSNEEGVDSETTDIAGILSREDLVINGTGALTIHAGSGDGIRSKDTLKLTGGTLTVIAADRGLVGKDSVEILTVKANITSGGDGIKSTNTEDPTRGYVYIEGGDFVIAAEKDGVQAETQLYIGGGSFRITTGTGSFETTGGGFGGFGDFGGWPFSDSDSDDGTSQKGLKAEQILHIAGGNITIDAYDDALHSDGDVTITDGSISVATGDDGIHAEETVTIAGGALAVTRSFEGIEGKVIRMTDGVVAVKASDDGLNATDGTGDTMGMFARGQEPEDAAVYVTITGGRLYVDAAGDGLDSNGTFVIEGGEVTVYGPADGANGYVDTAGDFTVNGGTYFGAGSSGMMVTPAANSAQLSFTWTTNNYCDGDSTIVLQDSAGNVLFEGSAPRRFNALTFSSEAITEGEEYSVYVNGDLAGSATGGVSVGGMGGFGGGFGAFGGDFGGGFGGGRGDKGDREDFVPKEDESMSEIPEGGMRPQMPSDGKFPGMPSDGAMPQRPTDGAFPQMPEGDMGSDRGQSDTEAG